MNILVKNICENYILQDIMMVWNETCISLFHIEQKGALFYIRENNRSLLMCCVGTLQLLSSEIESTLCREWSGGNGVERGSPRTQF